MNKEETIQSVRNEFKNLLLKAQKELETRDERFKNIKLYTMRLKGNTKHFIRKTLS